MSRIIFINPSVDKFADIKLWNSEILSFVAGKPLTVMPKLAPMILAALTPPRHDFVYVDEEIEDIDFDGAGADLVALTAMTAQISRAYEIAGEFRKRGVKVAIGGVHASVLPDEAALHADAVCLGEGENIWPAMLADLEAGALKPRYDAKDYPPVTELVSPRVDILRHDQYSMFPVLTSKGCPYDCDFCSIKFTSGGNIRVKPVKQVMDEIAALEKYNKGPLKKTYQFVDDNLYANKAHSLEVFKALKGKGVKWHGQGTLNTALDEETVKLMAESGCREFSIGFESISEACLEEANKTKQNKTGQYAAAIQNLLRYGIYPMGFFIFGFDNDAKAVFKETLDFVRGAHVINPLFSILTPYPGTRLYERVKDRIFDRDWKNYWALKSVYALDNMTPEELEAGHRWVCKAVTELPEIKRELEYFWSKGPWPWNPGLRLRERALLAAVALRLKRRDQYKECADFILWAAAHRRARDIFSILAAIAYNDMAAKYFTNGRDPAAGPPDRERGRGSGKNSVHQPVRA